MILPLLACLGGCAVHFVKNHDSDAKKTRVALDIEQSGKPLGTIVLELEMDKTPITAKNFIAYCESGYYDNTLIHRVTVGPRIHVFQGGGYTELNGREKPGRLPNIKNEADRGLPNERGTISMARDAAPDTANSEFFVNIQDNSRLNYTGSDHWGYCAFGRVVSGMDIVDRIAKIETRTNPDPELKGEKSQPIDPPIVRRARVMR